MSRPEREIFCDRPRVAGDNACAPRDDVRPTWVAVPVRRPSVAPADVVAPRSITTMIEFLDDTATEAEAWRRQTIMERAAVKAELHRPVTPYVELSDRDRERCSEYAMIAAQLFRERFVGIEFEVTVDRCKILEHDLVLAEGSASLVGDDGRTARFGVSVVERLACGAVTAGLWAPDCDPPYEIYGLQALADALRAQTR